MVRRKRSLRGGPLCRGAVVVAMAAGVAAANALVAVKAVVALVAIKAIKAVKAVVAIKAVGRVYRHRAQVLVIDLPSRGGQCDGSNRVLLSKLKT